jgi:hypothetical protein
MFTNLAFEQQLSVDKKEEDVDVVEFGSRGFQKPNYLVC